MYLNWKAFLLLYFFLLYHFTTKEFIFSDLLYFHDPSNVRFLAVNF